MSVVYDLKCSRLAPLPYWGSFTYYVNIFGGKGGRVQKSKFVDGLLTVGEEGGSTKVKMLTVVDGRRGGRVES